MAKGLKLAAAVLGTSVALMTVALPAAADPMTAKLNASGNVDGLQVKVTRGTFGTHLFGLDLADGSKLKTYCINIRTRVDFEHPDLTEKSWDNFPDAASLFKKNRAKINWLLHNSYPFLGLDALQQALADNKITLTGGLSKEEAIAGTQAAAWHFSDEANLDKDNPTPNNPDAAKDVLALYDYLTGDKNVGMANVPAAAVQISPKTLAGQPGTRIGPFTVSTTGSVTALTAHAPSGVQITDKDGRQLSAADVRNGSEVFVQVPASAPAGEGGFEVKASGDTGRVFAASDAAHPNQTQIVAKSESTAASASATATWAAAAATTTTPAAQASSGPALASTGASIFVPLSLGVLLLAAGAGALLFLRRRGRA